ncbi:hypothetical protein RDV89_00760 [Nocardioides zeae]|uniref:DUF4244 domain-containing protein n=1 Tax=Nocardioides imazamoxiresistens TaxID=3231893 RepID=A0ABU3PRR6_9ACTN|nr:hypothetical protein [Nocardioides zeae]MDT9591576.1 hypothetical protein [Nocardioides zeae]
MSVSGFLALLARLTTLVLPEPIGARRRTQRGDVPGWVMVTVMTAGLVYAIWTFAGPELNAMLTRALGSVSGLG